MSVENVGHTPDDPQASVSVPAARGRVVDMTSVCVTLYAWLPAVFRVEFWLTSVRLSQ
jgi:hypothetical protein